MDGLNHDDSVDLQGSHIMKETKNPTIVLLLILDAYRFHM